MSSLLTLAALPAFGDSGELRIEVDRPTGELRIGRYAVDGALVASLALSKLELDVLPDLAVDARHAACRTVPQKIQPARYEIGEDGRLRGVFTT